MIEILDAVRDTLRSGMADPVCTVRNCNVEADGSPPPIAPEIYIGICEGRVTTDGERAQYDLHELHFIDVVISIRVIGPIDRFDEVYRRGSGGLRKIERQVLQLIHGKQAVRALANANTFVATAGSLAAGETEYLNPLYYAGRSRTEVKPVDWSKETANDKSKGWLVRRLPFAGMRRVLNLDHITA